MNPADSLPPLLRDAFATGKVFAADEKTAGQRRDWRFHEAF